MSKIKVKSKIKAVIFDMDGVLVLSIPMWLRNFNSMRRHYGLRPIGKKEFLGKVINKGGITKWVVKKYFPKINFNDFNKFYFKNVLKYVMHSKVNPQGKGIFKKLKKYNMKICVVTNTFRGIALKLLKMTKLLHCIDYIVCGNEITEVKPAPDGILMACRLAKIKPSEAIYVGDAESDLIAAKRAKVSFVGYKRGGDFRVDNLNEIIELIFSFRQWPK